MVFQNINAVQVERHVLSVGHVCRMRFALNVLTNVTNRECSERHLQLHKLEAKFILRAVHSLVSALVTSAAARILQNALLDRQGRITDVIILGVGYAPARKGPSERASIYAPYQDASYGRP